MIVDEIQCGIGRSGKFFAFEYADIVPDVILVSKAIGGSQPLAVVVYNKELDKWNPGAHAGTFRGNQLAMRAGTALIKRVSQPEFLNEVVEKGTYMRDRLLELKKKVSIIGDIREKGLMMGIEFVNPNATPDKLGTLPGSGEIATEVQHKCFEKRLVMERGGRNGAVMRCLCALNVTRDEINKMLEIFESVVMEVDAGAKK